MSTQKNKPGAAGTNEALTPTEAAPPISTIETKPMRGVGRLLHHIKNEVLKVLGIGALAAATGYGAGKYAESKYQDFTGYDPKTMDVSATDNPDTTETSSASPVSAAPQQPQAPQTAAAPQIPPLRRNSDGTIAHGSESSSGGFIDSMKQVGRDVKEASQGAVEGIKELGHDVAEIADKLSPEALLKKAEELETKAMYYKNLALTTGNETVFYLAFSIATILAGLVYRKILALIIETFYPSDTLLVDNVEESTNKLNEVIARVNSMGTSQNSSEDKEAMKKEIAELSKQVTDLSNAHAELTRQLAAGEIKPHLPDELKRSLERQALVDQRLVVFFAALLQNLSKTEGLEGDMTAITEALEKLRVEQGETIAKALEGMDARMQTVAQQVVTARFKQALSAIKRD